MLQARIPLEKQVCTVEQSKQLVALGADLDSFTCWVVDTMNPHWNNGYALTRLGWEAMQLIRASDSLATGSTPTAHRRPVSKKAHLSPPEENKELWPAYTSAELAQLAGGDYYATFFAYDKWHYIDLRNECPFRVAQDKQQRRASDTEAQARAAMVIDLLTHKGALEHCRVGHEMPFGLPFDEPATTPTIEEGSQDAL